MPPFPGTSEILALKLPCPGNPSIPDNPGQLVTLCGEVVLLQPSPGRLPMTTGEDVSRPPRPTYQTPVNQDSEKMPKHSLCQIYFLTGNMSDYPPYCALSSPFPEPLMSFPLLYFLISSMTFFSFFHMRKCMLSLCLLFVVCLTLLECKLLEGRNP